MSSYIDEFQGRFIGIMQWDDCDALLQKLINQPDGWYLYDTLVSAPIKLLMPVCLLRTSIVLKKF